MGIIPDPDIDFDNHCRACWPDGQTPSQLKVFLSSMECGSLVGHGGGSEYNGYYDVFKVPGVMCAYQSPPGSDPFITLMAARPSAWIHVLRPDLKKVFWSWDFPPCTRWFENHSPAFGNWAHSGFAYFCSSMELLDLYDSYIDLTLFEPRWDLFVLDNHQVVLRVARITDGTLMHFKIDVS